MRGLRIALPGGTLFDSACGLLDDAGIASLDPASFDRELSIRHGENVFVKVRPTDVPVYVEMGGCECGIVGKDVLWESSRECYELADLGFGLCRPGLGTPLLRRALAEHRRDPPARVRGAGAADGSC